MESSQIEPVQGETRQETSPKEAISEVKKRLVSIGFKLPKINIRAPKKLLIGAAVFVFVLILLSIVLTFLSRGGNGIVPAQTPSPSPSATPTVVVPSEYADDNDVKQIQDRMDELERNLNNKSFRDDTLRIPSLDWNVKF